MNSKRTRMACMQVVACGIIAFSAAGCTTQQSRQIVGEAEFKQHCIACHANGGNSINPAKTLLKADREKNGLHTSKDLIGVMRKPGPGMTTFDEESLPEQDAEKIADYILNTYK